MAIENSNTWRAIDDRVMRHGSAADSTRSHFFTAAILLFVLGIAGWALHGGASALNAARLFGS